MQRLIRGLPWFFGVALVLFWILKVAQIDVMRDHEVLVLPQDSPYLVFDSTDRHMAPKKPSTLIKNPAPLVDYKQDNDTQVVMGAFIERLGNVSTWNTVACLWASFLLLYGIERLNTSPPLDLKNQLSFRQLGSGNVRWYCLVVVVALTAYLWGVHDDDMPKIAGTFYTGANIAEIRWIQHAEGCLNVVITLAAYLPFLFSLELLRIWNIRAARMGAISVEDCEGYQKIVNIGLSACIAPAALGALFVSISPRSLCEGPNAPVCIIAKPSAWLSMIGGVIVWMSPYFFLTYYWWKALRLSAKLKFNWVSLFGKVGVLWMSVDSRRPNGAPPPPGGQ